MCYNPLVTDTLKSSIYNKKSKVSVANAAESQHREAEGMSDMRANADGAHLTNPL